MEAVEAAWLAGLLEGEGCFSRGVRSGPKVQLQMTDRDVVARAAALIGGNGKISAYDRSPNRKVIYRVNVQGEAAIRVMMAVYPLMGERRRAKIRDEFAKAGLEDIARLDKKAEEE